MTPVAVMAVDSDDNKHILVAVCFDQAYASKNQKHLGFIVGARFIPSEDAEPVSDRERDLIIRTFFALRAALSNVFESV